MNSSAARLVLARLHEAQNLYYSGGDGAALRELLTPDIHWHVPGTNAIAGDYVGHEAVFAYFETRRSIAKNTFRMHPKDVLTGQGPRIAALTDGTATIGRQDEAWSTIGLYDLDEREQRITACWLLPLDQHTFDRVWQIR